MVGDEDVSYGAERQVREHELPRHSVAAVHYLHRVVDDDRLSGRRPADARPRTACGAEQNEPRALALLPRARALLLREAWCGEEHSRAAEKLATIHQSSRGRSRPPRLR